MASVTWVCNKDTRIARRTSDNWDAGAGASVALPFGTYSGYNYQTLLGFNQTITNYLQIDKAILWIRTSDQYYVAFGSDPDVIVSRCLDAWSEGSSDGLSSGNATVFGDVTYTATDVTKDVTTAINTWVSIDVTLLIQQARTAGVFHGLHLRGASTASTDVGEIWSREKGTSYRAYIEVDYTNTPPNSAPYAPTLTGPGNGTRYGSGQTGTTFTANAGDPDAGDWTSGYDLQVATDSGFSGLVMNVVGATGGISGGSISVNYSGPALVAGQYYWWRMRTKDAAGVYGPWSGAWYFSLNSLPYVSALPYGGANHVAHIPNLAELTTTLSPQFYTTFTVASADGEPITGYQVHVAGVVIDTVYGSWAPGTTIGHTLSVPLTNTASYTVQFRVADSFEGWGPWSAWTTFALKYMQAIYEFNTGAATGILVQGSPGTLLYRTATGAGGAGAGGWSGGAPGSIPSGGWLNVMVRLASEGSTPSQPQVPQLKVTYTGAGGVKLLPLGWTFPISTTPWSIADDFHRYGVRSLRYTAASSSGGQFHHAYQTVEGLIPDHDYTFSVWCNLSGVAYGGDAVYIQIRSGTDYPAYVRADPSVVGWQRLRGTFHNPAGRTAVDILLVHHPDVVAPGVVSWDAVMLNEGLVAPVWTPALVGQPVIMDAQGVYVDGTAGGIFRYEGTWGGVRDVVAGGSHGLTFGADAEISSKDVARLWMPHLDGPGMYGLRAPTGVTGGGTVGWDASKNFTWSSRFIPIGLGNDPETATVGYFDIEMPPNGTTIPGVGGQADLVVSAAGVLLDSWQTLWYIMPFGAAQTSQPTSFRISQYGAPFRAPSNWLRLASHNMDEAVLYVVNGQHLRPRTWKSPGSDQPCGTVVMWAGDYVPTGWLQCNGQYVTVSNAPGLFQAIGYRYGGSGGGFNVPNMSSRGPHSAADFSSNGLTGGSTDHQHYYTQVVEHTHQSLYANAAGTGTPNPVGSSMAGASSSRFTSTPQTSAVVGGVGSTGYTSWLGQWLPYFQIGFIIRA